MSMSMSRRGCMCKCVYTGVYLFVHTCMQIRLCGEVNLNVYEGARV